MPQLATPSPLAASRTQTSPTTTKFKPQMSQIPASSGQPRNLRHVLEFEKPLSKLEEQIAELEEMQAAKAIDYTKELRQLRTNYTALLRKTYDNLTPWEVVQV